MQHEILGLHHVTAIASDPQRNLDFYTGLLGMRLVKLTVNFDDPGSYHFYFGDENGTPGSILTFFPWPGAARGRQGNRQATATAFAVPDDSLDYWSERLSRHGVSPVTRGTRFGEAFLAFADPDGLPLELVAQSEGVPATGGPIPSESAIRGIHSVTLELEASERTSALLTESMGYVAVGSEGERTRYAPPAGGTGAIDIICRPAGQRSMAGAGTIHHVAFRVRGDDDQVICREALVGQGFNVSPVMDREYFHSIYFREPGHVLFEIATDPPGFTADETAEGLGTALKLPTQYEAHRAQVAGALPPLRLPEAWRGVGG